ncbi:MAG: signal peptide peptidase SppA [Phycisphaerae bacterium]|nr:signal peptide peptidase SppA [Phycisphaerae bacterium]
MNENVKRITTRPLGRLLAAVLAGLLVGGCSAPSLLITPVSGKRDLKEVVLMREGLLARDKIALVDVSGVIMNNDRPQFFGEGEQPVSRLLEQLQRARDDAAVKAVILRINSPGGSVVASQLMYAEIADFRRTGKPVVAMLMDVAASGGYYIACACDEIIAQPATVTGSIGVIMQTVDLSGTMAKIGMEADAITSGSFKDAGSPFRGLRPEERALFQSIVNDMYQQFVHVVDVGRPNLDEARVRTLADGRVYSAPQALEAGLIDRISTMREAIASVKQRIGAERITLVRYSRPTEFTPNYYAAAPTPGSGEVNLLKLDLGSLSALSTPRFMYLWAPGW